jgi:uncharacterized metal-binding protein YceD (DUF177 family)
LHPESYEIDLKEQLYEFMVVSLPSRITHELEDDCNQEVMESYRKFIVNPGDDDDEFDWDGDEDEDWDDEEDNEKQDDNLDTGPDDNRPIDPRWSALVNLN